VNVKNKVATAIVEAVLWVIVMMTTTGICRNADAEIQEVVTSKIKREGVVAISSLVNIEAL
jgi:hypothetical protein